MYSITPSVSFQWSNNSWLSRSANPYFGRTINFGVSHSITDIVYEQDGGITVDDGEVLDKISIQSNRSPMD